MKIHTFHTYDDLCLFYKDFEKVLEIYENLRYFLHYKNSLNIHDEKIFAKISELEKISGDFLVKVGDLYQVFYLETSPDFLKNIKKSLQNRDNPYYYTARKFLLDLDFYKNCDKDFFREKQQIESLIREITLLQEQNTSFFYSEQISEKQFLDNSIKNYFEIISLRTELLSYSPYNSVAETSFAEMGVSKDLANVIIRSFA